MIYKEDRWGATAHKVRLVQLTLSGDEENPHWEFHFIRHHLFGKRDYISPDFLCLLRQESWN